MNIGIFLQKKFLLRILIIIVVVIVVVWVAITFFLGGSGTLAQEMRLEKYFGEVTLHNSEEMKEIVEGSRLVSQDNLETFLESNAYISLDNTKALKVDQVTHMEVIKVDTHLDIELYKGSVYFDVSQPLTEEESLEFHTNNIVTGVRGTSGVITYTEDTDQSQVVVLSGVMEVVTVEENPQFATIYQGEVAFATTRKDGTVLLEIRVQEDTPFYPFSSDFLDDLEGNLEEYNLSELVSVQQDLENIERDVSLDWIEIYAQHLEEIERYYAGRSELEIIGTFTLVDSDSHILDLLDTTYWLHDMDLDGIPELLLKFHYSQYASKFYIFSLFDDRYESRDMSDGLQYKWLTGINYFDLYLAIPSDGVGLYQQYVMASGEEHDFFGENGTLCIITKEKESLNWWDGSYGELQEGTPINTSTWTHYTDLSGLEWNGNNY